MAFKIVGIIKIGISALTPYFAVSILSWMI